MPETQYRGSGKGEGALSIFHFIRDTQLSCRQLEISIYGMPEKSGGQKSKSSFWRFFMRVTYSQHPSHISGPRNGNSPNHMDLNHVDTAEIKGEYLST